MANSTDAVTTHRPVSASKICFYSGCSSGYQKRAAGETHHLFFCPKDVVTRKLWLSKIPKTGGREFDVLRSRLCYKHFEEKFLIKEKCLLDPFTGGIMASEPLTRWRLTPHAVPSLFGGVQTVAPYAVPTSFDDNYTTGDSPHELPTSFDDDCTSEYIIPHALPTSFYDDCTTGDSPHAVPTSFGDDHTAGDSLQSAKKTRLSIIRDENAETAKTKHWKEICANPLLLDMPRFTWVVSTANMGTTSSDDDVRMNNEVFVTLFEVSVPLMARPSSLEVVKSVQICGNDTICVVINGKDVTKQLQYTEVKTIDDVNVLVQAVSRTKACYGIAGFSDVKACHAGEKKGDVWYSIACSTVVTRNHHCCESCSKLREKLRKASCRMKENAMCPEQVTHQSTFSVATSPQSPVSCIRAMKNRLHSLEQKIANLQQELSAERRKTKVLRKKVNKFTVQ